MPAPRPTTRPRVREGSILRPFLKTRAKGVEIRSVTLIGFSAGNIFLQKVLETPDANWIDGVVALDGAVAQKLYNGAWYQPDLETWAKFAVKAAQNQRLFVNAFTGIAAPSPKIGSTAESAGAIMSLVEDLYGSGSPPLPGTNLSPLGDPPPPPQVTISVNRPVGNGYRKIEKSWDTMPVPAITNFGNAWSLYYGGNNECDHIFMSRYVQRAVWRTFLAPRMNGGIHCSTEATSGMGGPLGAASGGASCYPSKKLLAPDVFPTDPAWPGTLALFGGLAAGLGMGYWCGRSIFG